MKKVITKENLVLISKTPGKQYLGDDETIEQRAQKDGTRWYYALNSIRARIGKLVEADLNALPESHKIDDEDVQFLLNLRESEKIFSQYRKALTDLEEEVEDLGDFNEGLLNQFDSEFIIQRQAAEYIKTNKPDSRVTDETQHFNLHFLHDFTQQTEFKTLHSYIDNFRWESIVKIAKDIIKKLKPAESINDFLQKELGNKGDRIDGFETESQATFYDDFLLYLAKKYYGLKPSIWHPDMGFEGLVIALKNEKELIVRGDLGVSQYASEPVVPEGSSAKVIEKLADYQVFCWEKGVEKVKNPVDHFVGIIGTETITGKDGKKLNTVIFEDPDMDCGLDDQRPVFRISYKSFESGLKNIYGTDRGTNKIGFFEAKEDNIPWALCADEDLEEEIDERYDNVLKRHLV